MIKDPDKDFLECESADDALHTRGAAQCVDGKGGAKRIRRNPQQQPAAARPNPRPLPRGPEAACQHLDPAKPSGAGRRPTQSAWHAARIGKVARERRGLPGGAYETRVAGIGRASGQHRRRG